MKKKVLLSVLAVSILGLLAIGFLMSSNTPGDGTDSAKAEIPTDESIITEGPTDNIFPEFHLNMKSRFNPITQEKLRSARSFSDFIHREHAERIVSYQNLSVILLENTDHTETKFSHNQGDFSQVQLDYLQTVDISTNLLIWADYTERNFETNKIEKSTWTPYLTVVPEEQAHYSEGKDALLRYIRETARFDISLTDQNEIKPAQLFFTVYKDGTLGNFKILQESGYPVLDEKMIDIMSQTSGKWQPALNSKGENVDQELVVFYGKMGC